MICANPGVVILYTRSNYYYNNVYKILFFSDIILILYILLVFNPERIVGKFAITLHFMM